MKIFTGVVENIKNAKTASVLVERVVVHPLYKKRLKRMKKYLVDDEFGAEVGDIVHFVATKPISKMKKWKIVKVEEKEEERKKK